MISIHGWVAALVFLSGSVASAAQAPAGVQAPRRAEILTTFAFLQGSRVGVDRPATSVLVFPGGGSVSQAQMVDLADDVAAVQDRLRKAMRLSSLDMVSWDNVIMKEGEEHRVAMPGGAGLLRITLVEVAGNAAVYDAVVDAPAGKSTHALRLHVPMGGHGLIGSGADGGLGFMMVGASPVATSGALSASVSYQGSVVSGPQIAFQASVGAREGAAVSTATAGTGGGGTRPALGGSLITTTTTGSGGSSGSITSTSGRQSTMVAWEGRGISRPPRPERMVPAELSGLEAGDQAGLVVLTATVGEDGRPRGAKVESGPAPLARAALSSFERFTFLPAIGRDGKPISCPITVTMTFRGPDDQTW